MNLEPTPSRLQLFLDRTTPGQGRWTRLRPQRSLRLGPLLLLILSLMLGLAQVAGWLIARREVTGLPIRAAADHLPSPAKLPGAIKGLQRKLAAQAPKGIYVVVDTAANRVMLRRGEETLRTMVASCGSGNVLEDPAGGRSWTFETPRGSFSVQSKVNNPVWIKPDWAYIEEGEAIPRRQAERAQPGMLGEYAVGIGQGYFIHGTLYKRLLGRNVSHGCVRLGDEDLAALVKSVPLGTRVIIY